MPIVRRRSTSPPRHGPRELTCLAQQSSSSTFFDPRDLRFSVGDRVWCRAEQSWIPGHVCLINYRDVATGDIVHPYQVSTLHSEEGEKLYVPRDSKQLIRAFPPGGHNESTLRFKIGARVRCKICCSWAIGHVIRLNYRENDWKEGQYAPYQVRLSDGGLIYVPRDSPEICMSARPPRVKRRVRRRTRSDTKNSK